MNPFWRYVALPLLAAGLIADSFATWLVPHYWGIEELIVVPTAAVMLWRGSRAKQAYEQGYRDGNKDKP